MRRLCISPLWIQGESSSGDWPIDAARDSLSCDYPSCRASSPVRIISAPVPQTRIIGAFIAWPGHAGLSRMGSGLHVRTCQKAPSERQ